MALELTTGITATDTVLTVSGTLPADLAYGYEFRIGDELLTFERYEPDRTLMAGKSSEVPFAPIPSLLVWQVRRGQGGSAAASHLAAASLVGVNEANVSGATTAKPAPWPTGPGGGAVDSVNGQTGVVVLGPEDVGGISDITDGTVDVPDPTSIEFVFGAGSGGVLTARVHLAAAEILTLFSDPPAIVAAPGAGKWLVFQHLSWEWKFGSGTYANCHPALFYDGSAGDLNLRVAQFDFEIAASRVGASALYTVDPKWLRTIAENKALVLNSIDAMDPTWTSTIVTSAVQDGGSGYAPGDTGFIGSGDAKYSVDTVDGGGAVLTYHLIANGPQYNTVSNPIATTTDGAGDGNFTIDVTAVPPPDGDLYLTCEYTVETLH